MLRSSINKCLISGCFSLCGVVIHWHSILWYIASLGVAKLWYSNSVTSSLLAGIFWETSSFQRFGYLEVQFAEEIWRKSVWFYPLSIFKIMSWFPNILESFLILLDFFFHIIMSSGIYPYIMFFNQLPLCGFLNVNVILIYILRCNFLFIKLRSMSFHAYM